MNPPVSLQSHIAFEGHQCIAAGPLAVVALAVKRATMSGAAGTVLVIDNASGCSIDIDTRGTDDEIVARFTPEVATVPPPLTKAVKPTEPSRKARCAAGGVRSSVWSLAR